LKKTKKNKKAIDKSAPTTIKLSIEFYAKNRWCSLGLNWSDLDELLGSFIMS